MLGSKPVTTKVSVAEDVLAARLNKERVDPEDVETESGAHPEGRKRGGVVAVYVEGDARVYYDEVAEEWVGYDNETED